MPTHCISDQFEFEGFDGHKVVVAFDGGAITSDAGAVILRQVDAAIDLTGRVAACFRDYRRADYTVHSLRTLVGNALQRSHLAMRISTTTIRFVTTRCRAFCHRA